MGQIAGLMSMYNLDGSAQDDEQDAEHGEENSCRGSGTRAVGHPQHLSKYNLSLELSGESADRCSDAEMNAPAQ